MKRLTITLTCLLIAISLFAQDGKHRFSPEKFQAELEAYVIDKAQLTQQETTRFLPLFREMHQKQRTIYSQQRKLCKAKATDEAGYREAIRKSDQMDLEIKTLQQTYHEKFLNVLPASKVFEVIKAENRFHREMWKKWNHKKRK